MKIKINWENEELFCTYSKERIHIGEKYVIIEEQIYDGDIIEKAYKLEYAPSEDDFENEEPFICEE